MHKIKKKNRVIQKFPSLLDKIRNKYILKDLLFYVPLNRRMKIIKYNKNLTQKGGYTKNEYSLYAELIKKASLTDLFTENYIIPYLLENTEENTKNIYKDAIFYKSLNEKQFKLTDENFFIFFEKFEIRIKKIEELYNLKEDYIRTNDTQFYDRYKSKYYGVVNLYLECLYYLLNFYEKDIYVSFANFYEDNNKKLSSEKYHIDKYLEFLGKFQEKIKTIEIIKNDYNIKVSNFLDENNIFKLMIEKVNNIKSISTVYDFHLIQYLNNTKEFNKLEIIEILFSVRIYTIEKLAEFSKLITNNNSLKLLIFHSILFFVFLINNNLIKNSNIKILLIVKNEQLYEFEKLEESIENDVYILIHTDKDCLSHTQRRILNSIKVLNFHCKKNLRIKFDYFSRFEGEMLEFEKKFNNFLFSNKMNYFCDDIVIDQKMKNYTEKFKDDKFKFFEYNDSKKLSIQNNKIQMLNYDDKKKITKMNLNFNFMNNMKSVLNNIQNFSNLMQLNITVNKKSDWFFNNNKKVLKNLKNIFSLKIKINDRIKIIEIVDLVDNVTQICENLKEFEFFTDDFNKEVIEKIIHSLLEKKKEKKFFKKLHYILIKSNNNRRDENLELRELNSKFYTDFLEYYPKIIFCLDNKYNEKIEISKLNI